MSVLSPAKSLDLESPLPTRKHSQPELLDEAAALVERMRRYSPDELSEKMSISDTLAELNFERFQDWSPPFDPSNARPAALMFAGDTYVGLDAASFAERDFTDAQKTVRILSGLYGVLRPLDLIQPYRLEMGSKVPTERGDTLYDFWTTTVTARLAADLADSPGPDALINLASTEYSSAIDRDALGARVITPTFLDPDKSGQLRSIGFFAKRARGAMARWLVTERVRTIKAITDFDGLGYRYDADRSDADQPVFVRS